MGGELSAVLPAFLQRQRWYQGKARSVRCSEVADVIPLPARAETLRLALVRVTYEAAPAELYVLPLATGEGEAGARLAADSPDLVIATGPGGGAAAPVLHDAVASPAFRALLLAQEAERRGLEGGTGVLQGEAFGGLEQALARLGDQESVVLGREQSNTSIVYGRELVLKLYRRLEAGTSLDLEIGRFLTEHGYAHTPAVLGAIQYRTEGEPARTVAIVQEFVPNQGDAWGLALDMVARFQKRAAAADRPAPVVDTSTARLLELAREGPGAGAEQLIGADFLAHARLMGQRTAELHATLASGGADRDFAPEPCPPPYLDALGQSMRAGAARALQQLAASAAQLPDSLRAVAHRLLQREAEIMAHLERVRTLQVGGLRIRTHGDLHLGQVLFTGRDFTIIDFEGEPLRPLSERRLKGSPLRDVAGMVRSWHYAAHAALLERAQAEPLPEPERERREAWARYWYAQTAASFLHGYFAAAGNASFLPGDATELTELLDAYLLEKALYELSYELNNRPHWTAIPLRGIADLLEERR
ncbi:MAG: hypothetical protein FIB01_03510 [Gemmatimonadetes bacterium]|nr:hypothetical protein [Gemmatimonadota bacterium]